MKRIIFIACMLCALKSSAQSCTLISASSDPRLLDAYGMLHIKCGAADSVFKVNIKWDKLSTAKWQVAVNNFHGFFPWPLLIANTTIIRNGEYFNYSSQALTYTFKILR